MAITFGDLWEDIWIQTGLPEMAKDELPKSLSDTTKKKLMKLHPSDGAAVVNKAVYEVEHGSVDILDELINRELKD